MFYAQLKFLSVKADSIFSKWISHSLLKSKGCNLFPVFTDVTLNIYADTTCTCRVSWRQKMAREKTHSLTIKKRIRLQPDTPWIHKCLDILKYALIGESRFDELVEV